MSKIIFYLKSEKLDKYGKVSLLAQITNDYKSYRMKVGKVRKRDWNKKEQRLKTKSLPDKEINDNVETNEVIDIIETRAKKLFSSAILQKRKPTETEIMSLLILPEVDSIKKSTKFMDVFGDFIEANKADKAKRTIMGYNTIKNFLQRFEEETKYQLNWENINPIFIDKLKNHTFKTEKKEQSYYAKITRVLTTFLHWAEDRNYYNGNIYDKLKAEEPEKEVIFLSMDELMALFSYDFKNERLNKTKDIFCFSCFTGLRYCDVSSLKNEHIDIKKNVLTKTQTKIAEVKSIPLNKFALSILDKYKDNSTPLPVISDQKLNDYIKECCKIIAKEQPEKEGFNRLVIKKSVIGSESKEEAIPLNQAITFHIGRKTFITNGIMMGMNIKVLQDMGAPKKEKDLKKYIKITDAFKSKVMDDTWNKVETGIG